MDDIPMPNVLDPTRPRLEGNLDVDTAQQRVHDLQQALQQAAGYGQQLWQQLAAVRRHLVAMLPDPAADDRARQLLTAPRGPADHDGWHEWRIAYEAVTSTLAGPHGDSGWGRHEARQESLTRRGASLHSGRTSELVDLATERRIRVEDQRGSDPAQDFVSAAAPEAPTTPPPSSRQPPDEPQPAPAAAATSAHPRPTQAAAFLAGVGVGAAAVAARVRRTTRV